MVYLSKIVKKLYVLWHERDQQWQNISNINVELYTNPNIQVNKECTVYDLQALN